MNTRLTTVSILTLLFMLGCSERMSESTDNISVEEAAARTASLQHPTAPVQQAKPTANAAPSPDIYSDVSAKLIKIANYRFEVSDVYKSAGTIETAIREHSAHVSSSDIRLNGHLLEAKMTIRVPGEHFQDLLNEIDRQSRFVDFRNVKTEDVSKQFVDLESRLRSKREVEQRYIDILRNKAGTIDELLNAERQIGVLHEEIEATISKINYLRDAVRYSSIHLEFYQKSEQVVAEPDNNTLADMKQALISGWSGFIAVVTAILYVWPLVVLSGIALLLAYVQKRRRIQQVGR